jgi:MtrB/PioB family decaheme-associated outer membrane protein
MKTPFRIPFELTAASVLVLAAAGAVADEERYSPLALSLATTGESPLQGSGGIVGLGLEYTSDDNFMFGQYNGRHEKGTDLNGGLQWQDFSRGDSYWQVSLADVGLDTREGIATWGRPGRLKVTVGFDSQLQVRNDSGRTPFRGGSNLTLPGDWQSGATTADFGNLDDALRGFGRELERDRYFAGLDMQLSDHWRLDANVSFEEKDGTADVAGAIYADASQGDAVHLPMPIDQETTEFDLGLGFTSSSFQVEGRIGYSDFDNKEDVLIWQNPYSASGRRVSYPDGIGGLGTAPDSEQLSGRITGQYIFSPTSRLQFDGSYAITEQDQRFLDYSVNPDLTVTEPLPRSDYDAELTTGAFGARLIIRPMAKLGLEGFYRHRNRDYDTPRDGYRYIRGDGGNQPRSALTVYNTAHDYRSDTLGLEASYRLPLRSRLKFEYAFEMVERENAAVEETEEDRITVGYRIQPWDNFTANLELHYGDRWADTYQWDQSYFALLDVELINATPDNQRYITHPELSQYYMSNRTREQGKLDLNWLPADSWILNFSLLVSNDDYDKTYTGLRYAYNERYNLSASYNPGEKVSATLYGGYDRYESEQMGRAFRGGAEKNAFEIYPPLPQASDPDRDWRADVTNDSITLGANLHWQAADDLEVEADYSYVDTESDQRFRTYGAADLNPENLPTVETTLHHFEASGTWHMREDLSLKLHYQYYRFDSDDWARQGVAADTIGEVLTFGERNPNEKIHYVGASVLYRWQ